MCIMSVVVLGMDNGKFICMDSATKCAGLDNIHIGRATHFVAFGVTRNVKRGQKLQSGWLTYLVDQHIC